MTFLFKYMKNEKSVLRYMILQSMKMNQKILKENETYRSIIVLITT